MAKYRITNRVSGADLGTFDATSEAAALTLFARDAGYTDFVASCDALQMTPQQAMAELLVQQAETLHWNHARGAKLYHATTGGYFVRRTVRYETRMSGVGGMPSVSQVKVVRYQACPDLGEFTKLAPAKAACEEHAVRGAK